jgi:hypothetical protein
LWLEYLEIVVTTEDTTSLMVNDARWMDDDLLSDFSDLEGDYTDEY